MASYKVLQDIEAEDTLVGPLTLRQCIYAAISIGGMYLSGVAIAKHVPLMIILFFPFIALGAFFAFPWNRQQPTEVWALAKVRFLFKPRKRIWNQTGISHLVTITVPKAISQFRGRNLSETEVKSRLRALADTIDSRGWAIKNIELGYYTRPTIGGGTMDSDRLVEIGSLPQEVPNYDISGASDIFDTVNNPIAQKFDRMMNKSAGAHREQLVQQLNLQTDGGGAGQAATTSQAPNTYWQLPTVAPAAATPRGTLPAPIAPTANPAATATQSAAPSVTASPDPAILELANNNDLNVATIAREAQARSVGPPNGEVVVSLHE